MASMKPTAKWRERQADAENMLRLYQLGLRVEAIAAQYHCSPWTVRQKIGALKKVYAQHSPDPDPA